jgi:hypothetical protein
VCAMAKSSVYIYMYIYIHTDKKASNWQLDQDCYGAPHRARSRPVGVSFDRAQLDQDRYGASPRARSRLVLDFGSFSRPRPPWLNRDRRLVRHAIVIMLRYIYTYIHTYGQQGRASTGQLDQLVLGQDWWE